VVEIPYDDSSIRDTGPTFVVNREDLVRGVDWGFKAWNGPGPPHDSSWIRMPYSLGGFSTSCVLAATSPTWWWRVVPAREILLVGGCIHCVVQQRPQG
jgi:agmatine/peptidylarginine deiminase